MIRDDEIFAAALDLPPGERAAFLDTACGEDADGRARLAALLEGYGQAAGFLEEPLAVRPDLGAEEKPGDILGRYTLSKKIGEGGCGVVYLAEQNEPVRRRVALKVIKLGMDTRSVIARFEAERQALALMGHPNIARVFDAGTTASGRPFFVMELVEGVPITRFCDEQSLPTAGRLELFIRVCLAVQHAHQKGIIHRDLKPSNILVGFHDGVPAPKVIDFGIAKATEGRLTEHTLLTRVDQFIGTPAYMSPEQAAMNGDDIDTRSDIYSLGVLLYELLTGRPPFDNRTLGSAGLDEIRRIIREVEPPRPSARIATLEASERTAVAGLRRTAAAQLSLVLRGDLDWIVMRCLEKDRTRRYSTATDLAADVRRHLCREPVQARPPQTIYRVRKFVARHRLACFSAAAVAAALIAGTVVSTRQAVRATLAQRAEALARDDALRRQAQAEDVLAFLLGDFRTELKKVGRLDLLDAVSGKAMAYFDSLDTRDVTDAALARQAKALTQIGEIRLDLARYPEAERVFNQAYDRASALAARHPQNGDMLFERAQAEYWVGFVHWKRGDRSHAREWLTRYRDSTLALATLQGTTLRSQREVAAGHHNLAVLEMERGELEAARASFLAELETLAQLQAAHPADLQIRFRVADVTSWLGTNAERSGDLAEANRRFAAYVAQLEALVAAEPKTAHWKFKLGDGLSLHAGLLAVTGRPAAALERIADAQRLLEALVAQDGSNTRWLLALQNTRIQRAALAHRLGNPTDALAWTRQAAGALDKLGTLEAHNRSFSTSLALAARVEAEIQETLSHVDAAQTAAARAILHSTSLVEEGRAHDALLGGCARACVVAGRIAARQNDSTSAREHWQRALTLVALRLADSRDWRLLDPAARASAFLGHTAESRALRDRLARSGYVPLEPWPDAAETISLP